MQVSSGFSTAIMPSTSIVSSGSMGGDITSSSINIQSFSKPCVHVVFTGTPVGVFHVDGSNDNSNFDELSFNAQAPAGSADNFIFDLADVSVPYIRIRYVRTSGTGTLNATVTGKQI